MRVDDYDHLIVDGQAGSESKTEPQQNELEHRGGNRCSVLSVCDVAEAESRALMVVGVIKGREAGG
jgi:hypothetical protein